jgi:hypothetical protein
MERPKTIFCDIDGTLMIHFTPDFTAREDFTPSLLEGTLEKLNEWDKKGYIIVLVTARRESMREITRKQLSRLGIFYDQLIMGISSGQRVLINDVKSDGNDTAISFNLKRNEGIKNIKI